jgi:hypothetical protein
VATFKHLGTALTNQKSIAEQINSSAAVFGPECFVLQLLSKNINTEICLAVVLSVVLYGCATWSLALREEHRLRV